MVPQLKFGADHDHFQARLHYDLVFHDFLYEKLFGIFPLKKGSYYLVAQRKMIATIGNPYYSLAAGK